jgi:hypothetical protein
MLNENDVFIRDSSAVAQVVALPLLGCPRLWGKPFPWGEELTERARCC